MAILWLLSIKHFSKPVSFTQSALAYTDQLELEEPPLVYVEALRSLPTPSPKRSTIAQVARKSSYPDNVSLGYELAIKSGYSEAQWECLYTLGMRESGWNSQALNKSSGAYGIAQSLPASKYDSMGDRHDPSVQIKWMIKYVSDRYGGSCPALQHSYSHNWY